MLCHLRWTRVCTQLVLALRCEGGWHALRWTRQTMYRRLATAMRRAPHCTNICSRLCPLRIRLSTVAAIVTVAFNAFCASTRPSLPTHPHPRFRSEDPPPKHERVVGKIWEMIGYTEQAKKEAVMRPLSLFCVGSAVTALAIVAS